jgi:tyrosyl-tRNA synthetase
MGKSEKGALYLDPELVSPYEFYQYWLNIPDADTGKFLRLFTYLDLKEIAELERLKDREANKAKERMAMELTTIVHGAEEAARARETSQAVFHGQGAALDAMPTTTIGLSEFERGIPYVDLFVRTGLCSSKSDARRLIEQGGASIGAMQIGEVTQMASLVHFRESGPGRWEERLRAGRKRYHRLIIEQGR